MVEIKEVFLNADQNGHQVILKEDANAKRYFSMFVGDAEFTAIAKEKGLFQAKRPLTHDTYLNIIKKAGITFEKIEIYDVKDNVYLANIFFKDKEGNEHILDSRPSDAVALSLNQGIPIFVNTKLLRPELTAKDIEALKDLCKSVKF